MVQLIRERNIDATMEWEEDERGFETLIVTPIESDPEEDDDENFE